MYDTLSSKFKELSRTIKLHKEAIPEYRKNLLMKKTNPTETIVIYFSTLELYRTVQSFIEVRNKFVSLDIFEDEFTKKEFLPVSILWLFVETVDANKDTYGQLIDMDFMNSKARVLRLWEVNYEDLLNKFEKSVLEMEEALDNIHDVWYNKFKNQNILLHKEGMVMYKMTKEGTSEDTMFEFMKLIYNEEGISTSVVVKFNPERIRDIPEELFLEEQLMKKYPEFFL